MFETDREPDAVNDLGVKWWYDKTLTDYAHQKNEHGVRLEHVKCFIVELPNGVKTRVIVENGEVVFDNPSMEAVGCRIDVMKVEKRFRLDMAEAIARFKGGGDAKQTKP